MKAPSRFSYTEAPSATMCVAWGSWVPARRALEPAFFFSCTVGRPGCSAGDAGSKVNGTQITPISSCQPPFRATVPLRPLVPQSENRRLGPKHQHTLQHTAMLALASAARGAGAAALRVSALARAMSSETASFAIKVPYEAHRA